MAAKRSLVSPSSAGQMDWEVEDAFRTLCRAKEIKKDAKLMGKVKEYAKEKLEAIAGMVGDDD